MSGRPQRVKRDLPEVFGYEGFSTKPAQSRGASSTGENTGGDPGNGGQVGAAWTPYKGPESFLAKVGDYFNGNASQNTARALNIQHYAGQDRLTNDKELEKYRSQLNDEEDDKRTTRKNKAAIDFEKQQYNVGADRLASYLQSKSIGDQMNGNGFPSSIGMDPTTARIMAENEIAANRDVLTQGYLPAEAANSGFRNTTARNEGAAPYQSSIGNWQGLNDVGAGSLTSRVQNDTANFYAQNPAAELVQKKRASDDASNLSKAEALRTLTIPMAADSAEFNLGTSKVVASRGVNPVSTSFVNYGTAKNPQLVPKMTTASSPVVVPQPRQAASAFPYDNSSPAPATLSTATPLPLDTVSVGNATPQTPVNLIPITSPAGNGFQPSQETLDENQRRLRALLGGWRSNQLQNNNLTTAGLAQ